MIIVIISISTHFFLILTMPSLSSPHLLFASPHSNPIQVIWDQRLSGSHPTLDPLPTHFTSLPLHFYFFFPLPSHAYNWHSATAGPQEMDNG